MAIDLRKAGNGPAAGEAIAVVNSMREQGVLIGATGPGGNVLKIRPPLVFQPAHVDVLVSALETALDLLTG